MPEQIRVTSPAFAEAKRTIVGLLRQESLEAQRQEKANSSES